MRRLAFLLCSFLPLPALSCELALILAVDVSGSVDAREYRIQMDGLAEAFRDGAISEALVRSEAKVLLLQWTGSSRQRVSIDWLQMRDFETTDALARQIEQTPRVWRNFSTAIGEALVFAQDQFDRVPDCARHVIDVSGDGFSNEGIALADAHGWMGETIVNGLAIEASERGLRDYFEAELIRGPGAFAVRAADFEEYPRRIKQKLLREITKQVSVVDAATAPKL